MGAPDFFSKFKTVMHKLIYVKNVFYPATIRNDNGAVVKKICVELTEPTTQSKF